MVDLSKLKFDTTGFDVPYSRKKILNIFYPCVFNTLFVDSPDNDFVFVVS